MHSNWTNSHQIAETNNNRNKNLKISHSSKFCKNSRQNYIDRTNWPCMFKKGLGENNLLVLVCAIWTKIARRTNKLKTTTTFGKLSNFIGLTYSIQH